MMVLERRHFLFFFSSVDNCRKKRRQSRFGAVGGLIVESYECTVLVKSWVDYCEAFGSIGLP